MPSSPLRPVADPGPAGLVPVPEAALLRRGRLQCRVAAEIAAAFTNVRSSDILSPRRAEARVSRARHLAMYLAHVAFQLRLGRVAEGFGRDRTSVAYGVARIEDERDDRDFDAQLTRLEQLAASCRHLSTPEGEVP